MHQQARVDAIFRLLHFSPVECREQIGKRRARSGTTDGISYPPPPTHSVTGAMLPLWAQPTVRQNSLAGSGGREEV
ncbi:hypothetical protein EYF80_043526 [Liparis tanakae]|uniref:Uncharacterized protein n=1 Tax=Liparis tanakae TaxID=230148 RepID=A0A4Z2FYA7_9TELE|nr:hypothetical protein EYF80_043526 [Liparis tanakae]